MLGLTPAALLLVTIPLVGLFSVLLARSGEGSRRQGSYYRLFFASLAGVGAVTLLAVNLFSAGGWLFSGATLGLMVVVAVYDPGKEQRAAI